MNEIDKLIIAKLIQIGESYNYAELSGYLHPYFRLANKTLIIDCINYVGPKIKICCFEHNGDLRYKRMAKDELRLCPSPLQKDLSLNLDYHDPQIFSKFEAFVSKDVPSFFRLTCV